MPFEIVRNDITKMQADAIVNPTDEHLSGSGGTDAAIHLAAGKALTDECRRIDTCKPGCAVITSAGNLDAMYIIHTVAPLWQGGSSGEEELMRSCYQSCLDLAFESHCKSIAIPLIGSGTFGFPKELSLKIAIDEISDFLMHKEMTVYIVVYDRESFGISEKLFSDIKEFIDDRYIRLHYADRSVSLGDVDAAPPRASAPCIRNTATKALSQSKPAHRLNADICECQAIDMSLADAVKMIDESFSQMLLRKIDEKGMTDSQCYKKANIDRKLFSKIRSDIHYRPSKTTAIAFAIALELSLEETEDMLRKAGFALSHCNKFDIIIEYFISHKNYNIFEINEALFAFDQSLLGG